MSGPDNPTAVTSDLERLERRWLAAWEPALGAWSRFTRLRPPQLCLSEEEAQGEGLSGSFAMIRLVDQRVVVSLPTVVECRLEDYGVEILAHEIGHHVLAPANLTDHARAIARMRWALPTVESQAPRVANLYTDLLINDRLERSAGLRIGDVYRVLAKEATNAGAGGGALWAVYMRLYEILWSLQRGILGGRTDDRMEGDAWLGARLIRSYATDWVAGAGRFAALLLPYLLDDQQSQRLLERLFDTRDAALGGEIAGLSDADPEELEGAIHPAADPSLSGVEPGEGEPREPAGAANIHRPLLGQARQPFEYGEILRASGMRLDDHEVAVRYYRERALPYLVPFPSRLMPESSEPLPEGLEPWDLGHPLDAVDWLESVSISPHVIPGMTTVKRHYGTTEGSAEDRRPLDLDLYVDSSGSMVNPQRQLSFPALAGAIVCLSALRAGAKVQATLWSGKHEFSGTDGFVRDEQAVLRVLTGYFGGGTAFPIHRLRDTFAGRRPEEGPAHILVVSDDGVSTLFDFDERHISGWEVSRMALERAGGGGTLVLQLPENWEARTGGGWYGRAFEAIRRARDDEGWLVHAVRSWEELIAFARHFSELRYGDEERSAR